MGDVGATDSSKPVRLASSISYRCPGMLNGSRKLLTIPCDWLVSRQLSRWVLSLPVAAIALLAMAQDHPSKEEAATKRTIEFCAGCHGPGGNSVAPSTPRLAAQQEAYLVDEIKHLRAGTRRDKGAHSYMLGTATRLDDETTRAIARYYAHQSPPHGETANPAQLQKGKMLFEQQVGQAPEACTSCHGSQAEGNGIYPRLAGQHAVYVKHELRAMQANLRQHPAMHPFISKLSIEDRDDLAAYLESL